MKYVIIFYESHLNDEPGCESLQYVTMVVVSDEFRSKVACQGDVIQLECNPNARIAIYSASFGRTEYESIQCPQPQGVPEQSQYPTSFTDTSSVLYRYRYVFSASACLVSYATEMVMRFCHGKRRCSLPADSATFGKPCRVESRMYLKVVYTCGE